VELNDLARFTQYSSGDQIEKNEIGGTCNTYGEERRGVYRVLVERPERKRQLGIPRLRREDNMKTDLQEVGAWTRSIWLKIGIG